MEQSMTTEQAIEYLETLWKMNQLNINLAATCGGVIDQEELWAHEAIEKVLLQAKSNLFLEMITDPEPEELEEKGENTETET